MNVVPLHREVDAFDLAKALRNIADDIEAGRYENQPTMAVVVLAVEETRRERDGITTRIGWQTHGLGKDCCQFTARGILASALAQWEFP